MTIDAHAAQRAKLCGFVPSDPGDVLAEELVEPVLDVGGTRFQLRQYPGVIEDMTEVVKADPMNATAYYMRGRSYYMVDQNMNSAEDAAKACALNKQFCMP